MKRMSIGELKDIIEYLKDDVIVEITDDVMANIATSENGIWCGVKMVLKPEDVSGVINFEDTTTNMPCCSFLPPIEDIKTRLTLRAYEYLQSVRDVTLRHPSIDEISAGKIKKLSERVKDVIFECISQIETNGGISLVYYSNIIKAKHGEVDIELNKFAIPGGEKEYRKMKCKINGLNDAIRIIICIIETYNSAIYNKDHDGKRNEEE